MTENLNDYRWLVSEAAALWLAIAREDRALSRATSVTLLNRLRKDLPAERAHLIVEQAELRERAAAKFSLAGTMFFTRQGLEQATDELVAAHKATRFPADISVTDLCCGIGGDLISLAARRCVRGVDLDPVAAELASANLAAGRVSAECGQVVTGDALGVSIESFAAWHCDPDRRPAGRRTTHLEAFSPDLADLDRLRLRNPQAAIKLAPATQVPAAWSEAAELEWISSRGECRQQVAWFGGFAKNPGQRAATVISEHGGPRTIVGSGDEPVPTAAGVGRYLYEPDASVLAAKLTAVLCAQYALTAVSSGIAYLTSDALVQDSALSAFEVRDILPFDQKRLKAYCREHALGRIEIKKRGVDVDPERLRKAIIAEGEAQATVMVTPVDGQVRAIVTRRIAVPST